MEVIRPQSLANNIVIVDGFSGSGKTLIMPLLSHFEDGEVWQIREVEKLCLLEYLDKIDYNAAKALIKMNFDQRIYELTLGRNVNFRVSDDSSVQNNLLQEKYEERIFDSTERGDIVEVIKNKRPILVMDAHYIFGFSDLYLKSFEDNLSLYIFMKRNPIHLIAAYFKQDIDFRILNDPMAICVTVEINEKIIPYYAVEYYEEYLRANSLEKVILFVYNYHKMVDKMYMNLSSSEKEKFIFIPFEIFSSSPEEYLEIFEEKLNKSKSLTFDKMYHFLNLPREKEPLNFNLVNEIIQDNNINIEEKYYILLEEMIDEYKLFLKEY